MSWEELKKGIVFASKRAKETKGKDQAFWLGFTNALEMVAFTMYREEYGEYMAENLSLDAMIEQLDTIDEIIS